MGTTPKKATMKFAIVAVVLAVFATSHAMPQYQQYQLGQYEQQRFQQPQQQRVVQYQPAASAFNQGNNNFDISQFLQYLDPALLPEGQALLLKTVQRTNEIINGLPPMPETAAQMAELWGIAYPQLKGLLTKAGVWANQVPVPA